MVLSAASGGGHVRAADALVSAFGARGIPAAHVEALQHVSPLLRRLYADYYVDTVNRRPWLLRFAYEGMDRRGRFRTSRLAFDLLQTRRLAAILREATSPVVLCTHFLPAEIAVHLRRKGRLSARVGVVMTDFDVHPLWLYEGVDWYFVAGEEGKARLLGFGVAPETVRVTGIPVDAGFGKAWPRRETRARLGLDPDLPAILLSAGGFGMGPLEALLGALDRVRRPVQLVVVCGRNEPLQRRLAGRAGGPHPTRVLGYTEEMHAWMAAADLVVGKAGGLTCAESLASGLVPVIVSPIPGPEERNAAILVEAGAAHRCDDVTCLPMAIDRLLDEPERLAGMRRAAERMARPGAAAEIASIVAAAVPELS
jgi:processive 1,2-diacylglycerol beta-glucosyltransferase